MNHIKRKRRIIALKKVEKKAALSIDLLWFSGVAEVQRPEIKRAAVYHRKIGKEIRIVRKAIARCKTNAHYQSPTSELHYKRHSNVRKLTRLIAGDWKLTAKPSGNGCVLCAAFMRIMKTELLDRMCHVNRKKRGNQ